MSNLKGCFSHESDDWRTPPDIYYYFINKGFIDPCPYQADFDGLERIYVGQKLFCNPPYSDISTWVDYLLKLHDDYNCHFALLVPSRTDTKWFHELLDRGFPIYFFKGRLHFNDSKAGAPFPSCMITTFNLKEDINNL